jgi:hypothetical protein
VNQSEPANEPIWTNAVSAEICTFVVEKIKKYQLTMVQLSKLLFTFAPSTLRWGDSH